MCNLPSVRHTRARLARIRNRTVYTRGRETDFQASAPGMLTPVSASRAGKSYADERARDARETVLADQRASEGVDRVDSERIIRFVKGNDLSAGRSVGEVLRVLDAPRSG